MEQKKALIADDEPSIVELMSRFVEVAGYESITASSGEEAVALAEKAAVIVMDTDMEYEKSGIDALVKIRAAHPDKPIYMMTGLPTKERIQAFYENGATGHFEKPCDFKKLVEKLKEHI